uniref:Uncharacterized protein n=1 Tax=Solanum tuberosum TaxID=4113 RepID=M1CDU8_SOLTU
MGKLFTQNGIPQTDRRFKIVNGTTNIIKEIDKERSSVAEGVNIANLFDALHVDELEDGELPADTLDDLNDDKHEHYKEVIRQEHEELDFSEGTIDKKLPVENITTNALMGREDP